jgi:hypothetical protein
MCRCMRSGRPGGHSVVEGSATSPTMSPYRAARAAFFIEPPYAHGGSWESFLSLGRRRRQGALRTAAPARTPYAIRHTILVTGTVLGAGTSEKPDGGTYSPPPSKFVLRDFSSDRLVHWWTTHIAFWCVSVQACVCVCACRVRPLGAIAFATKVLTPTASMCSASSPGGLASSTRSDTS